ncbi:MAG: hypothetical protein LBH44_14655 [Treponema sp.]|jgi:hypothetical protein|nr:hypothetical protein [Treponema sp.]
MSESSGLRDKAVILGWVVGLLLIISLLWVSTQPLQAQYLLRTVNRMFITEGETVRLAAPLPQNTGNINLFGYWYSIVNSSDRMFVFAVFQDGILIPLGAMVTSANEVERIIPLSAHAVQTIQKIPHGIMQIYVKRIKTAASANFRDSGGERNR